MGRRSRPRGADRPRRVPTVRRVFILLVRPAGPAGCERRRRVVVVVVGRGRSRRRWGGRRRRGRSSAACTRVRWTVSAGDGFRGSAGALEGMKKTTSGGYFCVHGTGAHQPVPSSEAHSLLHHARQADERALRAVVARHANLVESEGRARGSAGASGRRSDGVDKVQKTFATIWRQTPRATGKNGARSTTFELGGRGGGARKRGVGVSSVAVTARVSSIDQMSIFGWVSGGFRPRAEAWRRPDPRVVSTCLHSWLPANEGPRRKHGTGAREAGAHLGVLAQQGQSLIVEIVATSLFLPFRRHHDR